MMTFKQSKIFWIPFDFVPRNHFVEFNRNCSLYCDCVWAIQLIMKICKVSSDIWPKVKYAMVSLFWIKEVKTEKNLQTMTVMTSMMKKTTTIRIVDFYAWYINLQCEQRKHSNTTHEYATHINEREVIKAIRFALVKNLMHIFVRTLAIIMKITIVHFILNI